ncbi:CDP-alcohol phosphatidyltransferase family protein [Acinetobacter shaoyimingii]|uniref:CDP-alcohol phosphatidyltransferase family protein n=1 Tax=Acinetobacter shaoyimingii TaxID=2715164 RepID=A0A6G8RV40_9GAMM|nr:CDP-alcohol phosphatidyltransferase family protein [Acinetobacter shaoyimingii]QIO05755.1 CDP-alcohol phosphatidyltransferase family protein [Acinetobacter shaoyimingii]
MPSIYQLKPAFQNLLRPWVKKLDHLGVTANQVTLVAMFISIALALFLYQYYLTHPPSYLLLLFPIWMLVRMAFNAIDGMLAREFHHQSKLGAFYNELSDVIADTALYSCLMTFSFIDAKLLLLVTFFAILSEYTGVMAPLVGAERRYDGPMGKSDRAFAFGFLATFIFVFSLISNRSDILSYIINGVLAIMLILLMMTIYNRIKNSIQASSI